MKTAKAHFTAIRKLFSALLSVSILIVLTVAGVRSRSFFAPLLFAAAVILLCMLKSSRDDSDSRRAGSPGGRSRSTDFCDEDAFWADQAQTQQQNAMRMQQQMHDDAVRMHQQAHENAALCRASDD